jgi:hypothetical protein
MVTDPHGRADVALEDVAGMATEEEPAGPGPDHSDHVPRAIQEEGRDRHAHPEGVHGSAALQEKNIPGFDPIAAEPPPSPLPPVHWPLAAPRSHDHAVHRQNVHPHTDTFPRTSLGGTRPANSVIRMSLAPVANHG